MANKIFEAIEKTEDYFIERLRTSFIEERNFFIVSFATEIIINHFNEIYDGTLNDKQILLFCASYFKKLKYNKKEDEFTFDMNIIKNEMENVLRKQTTKQVIPKKIPMELVDKICSYI